MAVSYPINELKDTVGHEVVATLDLNETKTKTSATTHIVDRLISKSLNKKVTLLEVCGHRNYKGKSRLSLFFLANLAFTISLCGSDAALSSVALSNQLLCAGIASLQEVQVFELASQLERRAGSVPIKFHHPILQDYLSGLHLILEPVMSVMKFVLRQILSLDRDKWSILEFFFGLSMTDISPVARDCRFHILGLISEAFNANQPYVNNELVLLMKRCIYETQDDSLCIQVHYELLRSHIYCYSLAEINENIPYIANYLLAQEGAVWNIYCRDQRHIKDFLESLEKLQKIKKKKSKCYDVKEIETLGLNFDDQNTVVISLRNMEYTITTLKDLLESSELSRRNIRSVQLEGPRSSEPSMAVASSSITVKATGLASQKPAEVLALSLSPYGYFSYEQYEKRKKKMVLIYYNMIKDLVIPHMQVYCTVLINAQYRKDDHILFKFTRNMRYDFYEAVTINPIVPMHWIKVKQPNGSKELEDRFKSISMQRYQSPTAASSSDDTAELVILNSSLFVRFMVIPPTGEDPVIINVFANSDDYSEYGYIGCDYDLDENQMNQETRWKGMKKFDNNQANVLVPVELPLPSNKDETDPSEMTTSTSEAKFTAKKLPSGGGPAAPTVKDSPAAPKQHIPEQQIKRHALEGFDIPGYCFYGDGLTFIVGKTYTIPTNLPRTRVLREGGNGIILEVNFEGTTYAVKQTAFRWREVLIMPKLHHPNVLQCLALLMGQPLVSFPRRRNIFHFYPRMTNDLGRNVGSYERYCLRSLRERYKNEMLLLNKIDNNFKLLFRSVLEALNYLHTLPNPIVHRDIKPSNILLKTLCACPNILTCVCRNTPQIVLSDFDASLELNTDGTLLPDPPRTTSKDFYVTTDRTYHMSPVGTIGFKAPEVFMYTISNSTDLMEQMPIKADIFSFGLFSLLVLLNEEGPKFLNQVGTLLLSVHQSSNMFKPLDQAKRAMLLKNGITEFRVSEPCVQAADINRILPFGRLKKSLSEVPHLIDFVEKCLVLVPANRVTAKDLLNHPYLR